MTNENEAPEQIWVEDERPIGGDCHVYNEPIKGFCNPIRYTLADLSDARIAELEAENRELHMQVIASDGQAQMAYEEQKRIEELEGQLKMVLDRESATQLRHDAKTDKLEALIAELEAKLARVIEIANLIAGRMMK